MVDFSAFNYVKEWAGTYIKHRDIAAKEIKDTDIVQLSMKIFSCCNSKWRSHKRHNYSYVKQ